MGGELFTLAIATAAAIVMLPAEVTLEAGVVAAAGVISAAARPPQAAMSSPGQGVLHMALATLIVVCMSILSPQ